MTSRAFRIDHLSVSELEQLLEEVQNRIASLKSAKEGVPGSTLICGHSRGFATSHNEHTAAEASKQPAQSTTMSERVDAFNQAFDPWEGSATAPLRWQHPFYQGKSFCWPVEAPSRLLFLDASRGNVPQFGEFSSREGVPRPDEHTNRSPICCHGLCVVCLAPCELGAQRHRMHECKQHRRQ